MPASGQVYFQRNCIQCLEKRDDAVFEMINIVD